MKQTLACALLALPLLSPAGVNATERFGNAYVAFDMPDGWQCELQGAEWVCDPPRPEGAQRSMIIILTAKEASHEDTLMAYQRHLDGVGRRTNVRTVETARVRDIGGNLWVDGSYDGSEVPGYITRYLAGTKESIAVLVTFSVHRAYFAANRGLVEMVANSLIPKRLER
jgi:hypothetical protein